MVKFRKPVIVAAMICFSAMMATGCLNPGNTSGTKQYISQNQKKTIETDNLKIKQYIGMKVNCEKENTITDKDVEDAVPEYLAENDLFEKDTTSEIKKGDTVNIAFIGRIDGKAFENGTTDSYDVEIGSKSLIDTFEDQLIGHKAGDKVSVNVTFPKDYQEKTLAGKKAVFETTINYIKKEVSVPDKLTDSFIAKYTTYKTVKDYKEYAKKALTKDAKDSFKSAQESAITDALLKNTEVTKYPEKRLQEEIDYNIKYYKNYAKSMGISYKEIIKQMGYSDEKAYKEDLEKYSKSTIKYYMMCEAIAKEEGLEISDADFKEKATALAKEYDYDTLTAMERNYSDDRIKEVLTAREVTKFVIKNTNFNYTEATTEQTINTNASDSTVTSETSDASTTEESSTGADSTEVNSTEVNSTEVGTSAEK